jgi:hypothetical protein
MFIIAACEGVCGRPPTKLRLKGFVSLARSYRVVSQTTRADGLLVVVVPKLGSDGKAIETGVAPHEWSWPLSDLVAAVGSTFDGSGAAAERAPSTFSLFCIHLYV